MVAQGGRACLLGGGGHAWLLQWGACVVAPGGHAWLLGGRAWLLLGGGACVVAPGGGVHGFFGEIRSMSGRYASYWNAFLLDMEMEQ